MKTAPKVEVGYLGDTVGSMVPVETHSHVEEHPGVALSTNLLVKLQPSTRCCSALDFFDI